MRKSIVKTGYLGLVLFTLIAGGYIAWTTMSPSLSAKALQILKNMSNRTKSTYQYPALQVPEVPSTAEVVILTVPKAGTHLLVKCLELFGSKNVYAGHLQYKSNREYLLAHPEIPVLIAVRDPRDVFVSTVFHYDHHWCDNWKGGFTVTHIDDDIKIVFDDKFQKKWCSASFNEKLLMSMDLNGLPISSILDYAFLEDFVAKRSNTLMIRFEDLVGSAGGGDDNRQKEALEKIAKFLKYKHSTPEIEQIAINLFGGSVTFREGKIGGWKKYYKPEHVLFTKEHIQNLLVKYGYEKNAKWQQ